MADYYLPVGEEEGVFKLNFIEVFIGTVKNDVAIYLLIFPWIRELFSMTMDLNMSPSEFFTVNIHGQNSRYNKTAFFRMQTFKSDQKRVKLDLRSWQTVK